MNSGTESDGQAGLLFRRSTIRHLVIQPRKNQGHHRPAGPDPHLHQARATTKLTPHRDHRGKGQHVGNDENRHHGDVLDLESAHIGVQQESNEQNINATQHGGQEELRTGVLVKVVQPALRALTSGKQHGPSRRQNAHPNERVEQREGNLAPDSLGVGPSVLDVRDGVPVNHLCKERPAGAGRVTSDGRGEF